MTVVDATIRTLEADAQNPAVRAGPDRWSDRERQAFVGAILTWKAMVLRRYAAARLSLVAFHALAQRHEEA